MQVCQFAVDLFLADSMSPNVSGGQTSENENREHSWCNHPTEPREPSSRSRNNALLHTSAKLSARCKPLSGRLNSALHLHARKGIRCARRADTHMSVEDVHLFGRKFTVEICVELCLPRLADHRSAPSAIPAVGVRLASSWRATSVTSRCLSEWKVFPQSPGTTSPPLRKEGGSRGNAPAVGRSRCEPVASSNARLGSFPASYAQGLVQVRPPPYQGPQSWSLSTRCVRSRTCYARCDTSMPGNWSPAGTTRTLSKPWRRFPEPGLRLRRDFVSASARSCKA